MSEKFTALVDHYHRTYDVAYKLWEKRNRSFLILLATLLVAALFTSDASIRSPFNTASTSTASANQNSFMLTLLCSHASQCDAERLKELKTDFPREVFNLGISVLVFYLMMNMYAFSSNISRYYAYIVCLEREIRAAADITGVAFTREGEFAKKQGSILGKFVGYFYWSILGGLLAYHFGYRILSELPTGGLYLWSHSIVGALTLILFAGYVFNSLGFQIRRRE